MGKNQESIQDLNSLAKMKDNFLKTAETKTKSFGGVRKNIEKIKYLANKIAGGESLDPKEAKFFEDNKNKEKIYGKINEIKNYEDDPNTLPVEVNEQVDNIEANQAKASEIVSQINNPKDKEAGNEELSQIKKDTDEVIDKMNAEKELIAEIQNAKKNLSGKELNELTSIKTVDRKSIIKKTQEDLRSENNIDENEINTLKKENKILTSSSENSTELKPELSEKEKQQLEKNKKILESWNQGREFVEKRKEELKAEGKNELEIQNIIANEWQNHQANKDIKEISKTIPRPKYIPKPKSKNENTEVQWPFNDSQKTVREQIVEKLTPEEKKEVEVLRVQGLKEMTGKIQELIKSGKTEKEAEVIAYKKWLHTESGQNYLRFLNNATEKIVVADNIERRDAKESDLQKEAKILNDLANEEIEIKAKYFDLKEKLEKDKNLTEEEKIKLSEELAKYEVEKQEINDKVGKQTEKVNALLEKQKQTKQEKAQPIIEKNDAVLTEIQKAQQEKVKKFFEDQAKQKEQGEKKIGFFKKTLDWWNNLENKKIKIGNKEFASGKIGKTIMSAGFIGTALYFAGDKLDLLPKNQTIAQKVGSRTFLAGLSSAIVTSNFTKNTFGSIKEKWSKLGTTGKLVAGTALGVGGAGAFVYFAGATTLGITAGAIATKLGINKVLFDKKIENLKIEKEKSEKRIEELNAKIKSFENDPNFDVEALMKELPEIQAELEKYNNKLRNWKIGKSLTSGLISLGSGLGSMAASHLEVNDKARELIDKSLKKIGGFVSGNREVSKDFLDRTNDILNKDNNTFPQDNTRVERVLIDKDGNPILEDNKIDDSEKIVVKPEAIIDGDIRKGITYTFRDQLCADEELAKKLGIEDASKLNDPSYVAKITKEIAVKTGYMDNSGHEIRVNTEGIGKVAYVLGVDNEGRIEVKEVEVETGKVLETHCEGENFEGTGKDKYEYEKIQKTYSDLEKAYEENSGIVAPERTPEYQEQLSNSYSVWEDDSREYLENNHPTTTPDDLSNDEIVAPEKINTSYTLENYDKYQDWNKIKSLNLKSFLDKSQNSDMYGVEGKKFSVSLKDFYQKALETSNNDEDFMDFVRNNPNLTVEEATNLYKDVVKEGDFTDSLKEKYNFFEWKESLNPKLELSKQEAEFTKETLEDKNIENILKEKYGKNIFKNENFFSNKEVKSIYLDYQKNLKLLDEKMYGDIKSEIAGQKVNGYLNEHENSLTDYIKKVQEKLGEAGNPKKVIFWGERLDKYLLRVTALAKLKGININPKDLLENNNDGNNLNNDDLNEYRPSRRMDDLKKESLEEYKPYPSSNQGKVETKDDLNEYKPSKKNQFNDDLNRNK